MSSDSNSNPVQSTSSSSLTWPPVNSSAARAERTKKWAIIAAIVIVVAGLTLATSGIALFGFLGGIAALSFAGVSVASLTLPNICVGAAALSTFAIATAAIVLANGLAKIKRKYEAADTYAKEATQDWNEAQRKTFMETRAQLKDIAKEEFSEVIASIHPQDGTEACDLEFAHSYELMIMVINFHWSKGTLQTQLDAIVMRHNSKKLHHDERGDQVDSV